MIHGSDLKADKGDKLRVAFTHFVLRSFAPSQNLYKVLSAVGYGATDQCTSIKVSLSDVTQRSCLVCRRTSWSPVSNWETC